MVPPVDKNVVLLGHHGQSTAIGSDCLPIISTREFCSTNDITFKGGARSKTEGKEYDCLHEMKSAKQGETIGSSMVDYLRSQEDQEDAQYFAAVHAQTGANMSTLRNSLEQDTTAQFKNASGIVKSNGGDLQVGALTFLHGEADGSTKKKLYKDSLMFIQETTELDAKKITGQDREVPWFVFVNSNGAANSMHVQDSTVSVCVEDKTKDKFKLIAPTYFLGKADKKTAHLSSIGAYVAGLYAGRAYYNHFILNKEVPWIKPLSATRKGDKITLEYDVPTTPLKIKSLDYFGNEASDQVFDFKNAGFAVVQDQSMDNFLDGTHLEISDVSVEGTKIVLTVPSLDPVHPVNIAYACLNHDMVTTPYGTTTGGNICDSTDEEFTHKKLGEKVIKMEHWLIPHTVRLEAGDGANADMIGSIRETEEEEEAEIKIPEVFDTECPKHTKDGILYNRLSFLSIFLLMATLVLLLKKHSDHSTCVQHRLAWVIMGLVIAVPVTISLLDPEAIGLDLGWTGIKTCNHDHAHSHDCGQYSGNKLERDSGGRKECYKTVGCRYNDFTFKCENDDNAPVQLIPKTHCQTMRFVKDCDVMSNPHCQWDSKINMCKRSDDKTPYAMQCDDLSGSYINGKNSGGRTECYKHADCTYDDDTFLCSDSRGIGEQQFSSYHCQRVNPGKKEYCESKGCVMEDDGICRSKK